MDYFPTDDPMIELELSDLNDSDPLNATFTEEIESEVNSIIIPTIYFLICSLGLTSNAMTLYVAMKHIKLNTAPNIYILNLVIGDVLVMLGLLFTAVQQVLLYWPFGSFLCRIVMMVDFINPLASIFFIMVMSLNLCVAVHCPKKSTVWQRLTLVWQKLIVAKFLTALTWLIASFFVLPVLIFADVNAFDQCAIVWPEPGITWDTTYTICIFALGFCLPILVTAVSFLLLSIQTKPTDPASFQGPGGLKLVVALFIVYLLCWLPLNIQSIVDVTGNLPVDFVRAYDFLVILTYTKSCINPFLYVFLSDDFKQGFRSILCC